ncbi:MAG: AbrB/MazE/SpoVT family DNA-binding domain-containing protein [Gluconacetobacter diazotrophicus]|nr:AbrB/MazE/SpoVT family DNA-binding domain-containing protein [Gluconacetobacter diazotrophicus]
MGDVAKIFRNGRSQAVRLPAAYRFDASEVMIRRDAATGDVILSSPNSGWGGVLDELRAGGGEDLFPDGRKQGDGSRDPFAGLDGPDER